MPEPDYITIVPAILFGRFNVVVMRYRERDDEYYPYKVSMVLSKQAAKDVAKIWALERELEIR